MENKADTWFERITKSIEEKVVQMVEITFLVVQNITEELIK